MTWFLAFSVTPLQFSSLQWAETLMSKKWRRWLVYCDVSGQCRIWSRRQVTYILLLHWSILCNSPLSGAHAWVHTQSILLPFSLSFSFPLFHKSLPWIPCIMFDYVDFGKSAETQLVKFALATELFMVEPISDSEVHTYFSPSLCPLGLCLGPLGFAWKTTLFVFFACFHGGFLQLALAWEP